MSPRVRATVILMQSRCVCRMLFGCMLAAAVANAAGMVDLAGNPIDPLKTAHGKPSVLIFLRTDCPISNRYAPAVQRLQVKYARTVNFWLIYPGKSQSPSDIQQQLTRYGYHIAALRDTLHELTDSSDIKVTPESALFSASGRLVYHGRIDNWYEDFGRARPSATTHELDDAIRATLAGKLPTVAATRGIGCSVADLE